MNTLQGLSSPRFSVKKRIIVFAALFALLTAALILSLLFGSVKISLADAIRDMLSGNFGSADFRILFYLRLPRAMAALFSGAALAVSGVIIQAVLENPMAAPNIIGVNSGAGLAAALTIAVFPTALPFLPLSAFLGALFACLLIYFISAKTSADKLTITLVGIAVGSVLSAGINTVKVAFPDSVYDMDIFMIGGFSGVTYEKIMPAVFVILTALCLAFLLGRDTDILGLGEASARSLGVNVSVLRFVLLITASALAGAAVSFSGLLGFVGLLVPHIMRRFVGTKHRILIPASALFGSSLVLICDLISRVIFAPYELPVGIILSLLGGVFFILLVFLGKRRSSL